MKYFLDTEFIEGFHKSFFGKRRHFIDLISIGIVREDGAAYHAISSEYSYKDASPWVKENVIHPMYRQYVHGDARNRLDATNFQKVIGTPLRVIRDQVLKVFGCWNDGRVWRAPAIAPQIYGYFADYDWVLFCSLFGTMMDLPQGFPMYCLDLKQIMINNGISEEWKERECPESADAHDALADARWNKLLFERIEAI